MRSIRTKLAVLVLTTVTSAVLLVTFAFAWINLKDRFSAKRLELQGIAAAIATSVARPLADGDGDSVARTLSSVGRIPDITYALVSDAEGRAVHQFGFGVVVARETGAVEPNREIGPFTALYLATYPVALPIIYGGNRIGQITLIADLSSLRGALGDSVMSAFLAAVVAAAFGLLMSRRLQQSISRPVTELTAAMQDVARTKDFDRRVEKTSHDEISLLVDAFNGMLAEVRSRDQALASHRDRLEIEVAERTAELAEATVAAEAASAAKSEFLAVMSHEIRTPLNGMLVVAELMSAAKLAPRIKRYADVLLASGQTLHAIINDILDLSKIEAGKLELEAIPVRPHQIVDDVVQLFRLRAEAKGLGLTAEVAAGVPEMISTDPVRLTQILSNLVNNALKFTESGGIAIAMTYDAGSSAARPTLMLDVIDTGIGIPGEKLATIFEAFSQADQSTMRRFGGTGIGLTICQRITTAMGGNITVTSKPGRGSTFSVRVPVAVVAATTIAALAAKQHRNSIAAPEVSALAGIRVLAADDNAINREVLSEAILRLGGTAVCVEDGRAAVEAIKAQEFDVVLMDCSMPVMDGYAATRAIRAWEQESGRAQLPIVAFTAHVLGERANAWRDAGMTGYLTKPYTLKSLDNCLAIALGISPDGRGRTSSDQSEPNPPADGEIPLIDAEVLASIIEMQQPGDDLASRVVRLFSIHAPRALETLLAAQSCGNPTTIAEAAHALRSLSRNIGALRIGDLCTQLESEVRDGVVTHVGSHCEAIQRSLPATIAAITAELAGHGGAATKSEAGLRQTAG